MTDTAANTRPHADSGMNAPSLTELALTALEHADGFIARHIGPDAADVATMLKAVGADSMEDMLARAMPAAIRSEKPLGTPPARDERAALRALRQLEARNRPATSMIGMGYHGTVTPPVIQRNVLEDPGWYTAYTPYQAEISQGRLEALLNFQQMIMDLTGMEIANASLLDEATAAAEAMAMSRRVTRAKADAAWFVDAAAHPQTIAVLRTRAESMGARLIVGDPWAGLPEDEPLFGVLAQYPGTHGEARDLRPVAEAAAARKILLTVAADPLALTLLTPPGEAGADIVVGSCQRFGMPMGYGGPHAAYLATREAWKRLIPGRIIGVSADARGRTALRMALQTREQHIRREKATSNICTAQVLPAVISAFYGIWHGPDGLRRIAARTRRMARIAAEGARRLGHAVETETFFDTFTLRVPGRAAEIVRRADEARLMLRHVDADRVGVSLDETTSRAEVETLWRALAEDGAAPPDMDALDAALRGDDGLPGALRRTSPFMTHPVFTRHRSETEMMRYMRRLRDRDITLNRAMIPLGSCTMKLNAAAEMAPISWLGFAHMHPFAPAARAEGYRAMFAQLEEMLCDITGFDALSLQPNAGSQGEYAGLLAIRGWHRGRGEAHRDVCLIPASAHGTNPASATMAGMRVMVVKCDARGNVDVDDLRAQADRHADNLAALMMTYPSTHGVFEDAVREICNIVHERGGQVYLDGANVNAMVGLVRPGALGADVAHLNLHKTFCIPHGGGGPGIGPIGVKAHLAPFLPGHAARGDDSPKGGPGGGPVAAAPWGSAGILPITWMYLAMMGPDGLRRATEVAILSANYIAARLAPHYPVLYTGARGGVAHECILDLRGIEADSGVSGEDVAKRLMDYGFHAPTMSFPVAGTLMVEPTESESLAEIDRFCDAMIAIRREIADVASGAADRADNLLKNAPHTQEALLADPWPHPYSRRDAAHPAGVDPTDKYWPPVGRVDNVAGDRTLVCACPPMEAYV